MAWGKHSTWRVAIVCVCACSVFDTSLVEVDAGSADAAEDVGLTDAPAPDVVDISGLRKPPPRPTTPDGPDAEPLLAALRDVELNQGGDRWRDIGQDLDDLNSVAPAPMVECVPPNEDAEPPLDGNGGIDNVFGDKLFPIVRLALPDLERDTRTAQLAGIGTILIRLSKWNGESNDPRVDVTLTQAAGGTSADPSAASFEGFELQVGGAPAPAPAWDGNDTFWARDDTYFMGMEEQPLVRDDNAYVSDRTVVFRLPDRIDILFFAGEEAGVRVRLTDGTAFGTLNEDATALISATVAGRWSIVDLLDTGDNIGICVGSAERDIVEAQLRSIADVRSRPGTGGIGVACDAISLGVRFTGVRAEYGGLGPSRPLPNPCE